MTGLKVLQFGLFLILLGFTVNLFSMALFVVALLISLTMQSMEALELSGQIIAWGSLSFPPAPKGHMFTLLKRCSSFHLIKSGK